MDDEVPPLRAAFWLQDRARQDPDIKALVHAAYRKYEVNNMTELLEAAEHVVVAMYEGAVDMLDGLEDMTSYDERVKESWLRQREEG